MNKLGIADWAIISGSCKYKGIQFSSLTREQKDILISRLEKFVDRKKELEDEYMKEVLTATKDVWKDLSDLLVDWMDTNEIDA